MPARFKLIGLVPAVAAVALGLLLPANGHGDELAAGAGIAISVFGFVVTLAVDL